MSGDTIKVVAYENKKTLDQLVKSAASISIIIRCLVTEQKEVKRKTMEEFLHTLDKILEQNPEYPVYQFLPELAVNIEFKLQVRSYSSYNELAQQIRSRYNIVIKEQDGCCYIEETLQSVVGRYLEVNKFLDLLKSQTECEILIYFEQNIPHIYKLLVDFVNQPSNFNSYTRLYDLERRIPEDGHYQEGDTLKPKTLWGAIDLKPYTESNEPQFLGEKTRLDLSDPKNQVKICRLLDDPEASYGRASDNFLDEIKLVQKDLESRQVLNFAYSLLNGYSNTNVNYEDNPRNKICARFFSNLKLNSENLDNQTIQEIIKRIEGRIKIERTNPLLFKLRAKGFTNFELVD